MQVNSLNTVLIMIFSWPKATRDFKSAINTNTGLDNVESDDENSECKDENDNEIISTNAMDIDTNDLDVLLEPSQYSNNFEYTKCDYQCTYEHVFFVEHMICKVILERNHP